MTKTLVILRGPSGTGKSTIANAIMCGHPDFPVTINGPGVSIAFHETDQFFTDGYGRYHFSLSKLKDAHRWNQLNTERSMLHGVPLVIVANTFIAQWEMEAYLEFAEIYGYEVKIIRTPRPWLSGASVERNKHNVPLDVVERHINSYQSNDKETEWTDMSIFENV